MFRTHLQWMRLPLKKKSKLTKNNKQTKPKTHTTMVDETKKKRKKYFRRKVILTLDTAVHVFKLET